MASRGALGQGVSYYVARAAFVLTLAVLFWLVFDCPLSFWLDV